MNVTIPENGSKNGKMFRLLIEIELDTPLLRGTKLMLEDELVWVEFKYEKLLVFCYYCGKIGHQERSCERKVDDARGGKVVEGQYGNWLRVQGSGGGKGSVGLKDLRKNDGDVREEAGKENKTSTQVVEARVKGGERIGRDKENKIAGEEEKGVTIQGGRKLSVREKGAGNRVWKGLGRNL